MKILALLGVAALAIACDSPTSPRAPLKAPTTLSNTVLANNRFEQGIFVFNNCSGESIPINAKFHEVVAVTNDAAGGFHLKIHDNFQGQGTNLVTGVNYVAMAENNFEANIAAGAEETFIVHFNLIAKGPAPNEVSQAFYFHVTVTPNGDVSSFHEGSRLVCQGG